MGSCVLNARETAGQPESQVVTWTQSSQEEAGAGSGLSLPLPWCPWDGQMLPGVRRHVRCGPSHMGLDVTLFTIQSYPPTSVTLGKWQEWEPGPPSCSPAEPSENNDEGLSPAASTRASAGREQGGPGRDEDLTLC